MVYNRGTLSQHYAPLKSYFELDLLAQNRYEIDLSNEVIKIHLGAAKISEVKVGGPKKSAGSATGVRAWCRIWPSQNTSILHHKTAKV